MTDITSVGLVHTVPGAADVSVEREGRYSTDQGPLAFDLYRPPRATGPLPAVVFVSGLPDPGVVAMLGKPLRDWASYVGWARTVAASGIVAITYENREPGDVAALLRHLRATAGPLGIDPDRIGVWACSGNVPTALALVASERIACAALLYGYLLDLDGSTAVADAAARFYFAVPPLSLADLPAATPLLVVRAGADTTPGLDATLLRFVAAARARDLAVTVLHLPDAPHAFDLVTDTPASRAAIEDVLTFLRARLGA